MGNCMGSEERSGYSSYYHSDHQLFERSEIYKPLPTSLFNTLRRPTDCAIITSSASLTEDVDILRIDFENASASSLKMLLNFKKIVYVGEKEGDEANIKKVKALVSFTKFYVVAEAVFRLFLQDYPIFTKTNWARHEMATNKLPLMLVDSKEFVHSPQARVRLFIHASNKMDKNVYGLLGVKESMIVKEPPEGSTVERIKGYYVNALATAKQHTIVMLHSPSMTASDILETISAVLLQKHKIPTQYSQVYLKRNWPNSSSAQNQSAAISNGPVAKTASTIVTGAEKFKQLFQKLEEESNEEKTERAYNLLSTLLLNIYNNPANEESYREVKKTNRQLNDLLIKRKNGLKILDEVGFREKDEHWVNTVESKYLKIYKTDLDLGFKRYKMREEGQQ